MAIDLNKYKNIIFDLGGVILNINYHLTTDAFKQLGLESFNDHFSQAQQQQLFDLYEKGLVSSDSFRNHLGGFLNTNVNSKAIDNAWNAMLLDLPEERLTLLNRLKETHRTFLLSNTNEIHIDTFNAYLKQKMNIPDFSAYFEKVYLSYKVNMRKPDSEIFNLILTENDLDPQETLFIDDSIQHIEGAKKLGIQTYLLDVKKESINDIF